MIAAGQFAVRSYLTLMLAFLYLPIAIMIAMAFNQSALYELPFKFSFVWFEALSGNTQLWAATRNSVLLATASTIIATILGTMAALSFARYQFRGKTLLRVILFVPVTVPWLIIATAMLVFFFWVGIGRGLHAMLLAHVALSLPYVIVIVGARLTSFPMELEEAAATLGATPWQVFRRVSAPIIAPGIVAAALFSFAISFDQFATSYFLSAPGVSTLPVEIYSAIRRGFTPEINAISAIVIVLSMGLMLIFSQLFRFSGAAATSETQADAGPVAAAEAIQSMPKKPFDIGRLQPERIGGLAGDVPEVDDRHAQGQHRLGLDPYMEVGSGEKRRIDQIGNDADIADRQAIRPGRIHLEPPFLVPCQHAVDGGGGGLPIPAIAARRSRVITSWWVRSRLTRTTGSPLVSTTCAA